VDLPWSIWAMMEKFRILESSVIMLPLCGVRAHQSHFYDYTGFFANCKLYVFMFFGERWFIRRQNLSKAAKNEKNFVKNPLSKKRKQYIV